MVEKSHHTSKEAKEGQADKPRHGSQSSPSLEEGTITDPGSVVTSADTASADSISANNSLQPVIVAEEALAGRSGSHLPPKL